MFNEFVLHLILDQAVHDAGTDYIVPFRHFIPEASGHHNLTRNSLRRFVPLHFQFLISDTIEEHLLLLFWVHIFLDLALLRCKQPIDSPDRVPELAVHPCI